MHTFQAVQKIPADMEKVWAFFSNPSSLQVITPPEMKLRILNMEGKNPFKAGDLFDYKLTPFFIRYTWGTEISVVKPRELFIDVQQKGPYSYWQHEHHFREIEGGVEMKDLIHYRIPLGMIGTMINRIFIKKKLKKVFEFRYYKLEQIFGKWPGQKPEVNFS